MLQKNNPRLEELQRQIAEQEALVRRMIVRGTPNQTAEDRLRHGSALLQRGPAVAAWIMSGR